jgi:hypothetical protein
MEMLLMSESATSATDDWVHRTLGLNPADYASELDRTPATGDNEPNQSVDPSAGEPNQSVDPNADQPNQSVDPNAVQSNQSVDPNAEQPNQSVDPNAVQPNLSADPNAEQPNQSVDANTDQPNQSVDPNAVQPNQSTYTSQQDDPVWQQGYKDGFANPNTTVTTPAVYAPEAAAVYEDGVAAGQADGNKPADPADTSNAAAPVFSNTNIQNIYVANSASASPGQIAALKALDVSLSGPWKNLAWATIAASAAQRVFTPSIIDQQTLGVCASAAAVQAEAATNALGYAQDVCAVFSKGELGGTKVNKDLLAAKPVSGMDPCDWMMLSAAQDTSNLIRDFKGQPDEGEWQRGLGPQGTKAINEAFLLKSLDKCVKTSKISCSFFGKEDDSKKVQALMAANGDKVVVLVENDGSMLINPTTKAVDGTGNPDCHVTGDHSVRLISLSYGATVKFKIFTWGQEVELTWDKGRYDSWVYGYMLGAKDASIDLP